MPTIVFAFFFAGATVVSPHDTARALMAEAKQTTNPVKLLSLTFRIHSALTEALAANPDDVEVRMDLVRYHVMVPRVVGGKMDEARAQAAEIARRDVALGHFARGYIAYREKQYGAARLALKESIKLSSGARKREAMLWLGWLSQESQQYDDAFAIFTELQMPEEIERTKTFCRCEPKAR